MQESNSISDRMKAIAYGINEILMGIKGQKYEISHTFIAMPEHFWGKVMPR